MSQKNISIVGLGYVGLTLAVSFARVGFRVYGVDTNEVITSSLRRKKSIFYEPGLDELLEKLIDRELFVCDRLPTHQSYLAHIISVGTPLRKDGRPNFDYLEKAVGVLVDSYSGEELVILRSTVSVGVTRKLVAPMLAKICGRDIDQIRIAFCPERTAEGNALEELMSLPQIISGLNPESLALSEEIFSKIASSIIKVSSLEAGELIKLFNNTYRDMHFALGNCFNHIAQNFGENGIDIIRAANLGYSRSNIPLPGFVGGPCLEKDAYILANSFTEHKTNREKDLVLSGRSYNESLVQTFLEWFRPFLGAIGSDPVTVSGLAFKGSPKTSDMRGSPAITVVQTLKQLGVHLRLHDFCVEKSDLESLDAGDAFGDLEKACEGSSALIILNNHDSYKDMQCQFLLAVMRPRPIIFDAWRVTSFASFQDVTYADIGSYLI